jgi:hypothetical protein
MDKEQETFQQDIEIMIYMVAIKLVLNVMW